MKITFTIALLLLFFSLCAQEATKEVKKEINSSSDVSEFSPELVIAPLLPLTQDLLITINSANRSKYVQNLALNEQKSKHIVEALKSKAFPWQSLFAGLAVLIAIMLVKAAPPPVRSEKVLISSEEQQIAAANELAEVERSDLNQKELYNEYFARLDHAVRTYLEGKYSINAPAYTSQELLHKVEHHPAIDRDTRSRLLHFLQSTDQVKYAYYHPTKKECLAAIEEARKLLQKTETAL